MNLETVKDILKLNKDFYQSVSTEFSRSRQKPWVGWNRAVETSINALGGVNKNRDIKVLDLGCGNGRFYEFISKKISKVDYLGLDINNDLLNISKTKYKTNKATFLNKDIYLGIDKIKGKYNIISAFGVTHHIPNNIFRIKWFKNLPSFLGLRGVIILTFWNFEEKPGDYLLGWGNKKKTARYCHQYSEKEINKIISIYKKMGLKLIDKYKSDKENLYLIFGKI